MKKSIVFFIISMALLASTAFAETPHYKSLRLVEEVCDTNNFIQIFYDENNDIVSNFIDIPPEYIDEIIKNEKDVGFCKQVLTTHYMKFELTNKMKELHYDSSFQLDSDKLVISEDLKEKISSEQEKAFKEAKISFAHWQALGNEEKLREIDQDDPIYMDYSSDKNSTDYFVKSKVFEKKVEKGNEEIKKTPEKQSDEPSSNVLLISVALVVVLLLIGFAIVGIRKLSSRR